MAFNHHLSGTIIIIHVKQMNLGLTFKNETFFIIRIINNAYIVIAFVAYCPYYKYWHIVIIGYLNK